MFQIYAVYTGKKENSKDNMRLRQLISFIALKFQVVYGKRKKPIVLYEDLENGKRVIHWKNTERFIAKYATRFIRNIPLAPHYDGYNAGRYASKRQIERMLDENSLYTSVNSVIILLSILHLLQLSIDDKEFQALCYNSFENYHPSLESIVNIDNDENLCYYFLRNQFKRLYFDPDFKNFAPNTIYLAEYVALCSDALDEIIGNNAFRAVRITDDRKRREIREVEPKDFPQFRA